MKLKLLLIFLFSFVFTHSSFALSENNIIVFGDSLSDIGNNNWIEAIGAPITSFDEKGHKNTWAKYLSSKLFSKPMLPSNKENVNPLIDNVNYAYASADTSSDYLAADWPNSTTIPLVNPACKQPGLKKNNEGKVTSSCVPGVLEQINLYLKDVKSVPCSKSIFFIWAGANDLFYKLPSQPPQQIIATAVGNLLQAKNKLLENGISPKQIYILNLPDLSLTPFAIQHGLK